MNKFPIADHSKPHGIPLSKFDPHGHLTDPESDFIFGNNPSVYDDYYMGPVASIVSPLDGVIPSKYCAYAHGPVFVKKTVTSKVLLEKIAQLAASPYRSDYDSVIQSLIKFYELRKRKKL